MKGVPLRHALKCANLSCIHILSECKVISEGLGIVYVPFTSSYRLLHMTSFS